MQNKEVKLNPRWIRSRLQYFRQFLEETGFPEPKRNGKRGPGFDYPEWLIMFIAVMAVKLQIKTYQGIHRMSTQYWEQITPGNGFKPISERQLRDRLKKIGYKLRKPPGFIFQIFPDLE